MTLQTKTAVRFAAAVEQLAAGRGGAAELKIVIAGASIGLVLADCGIGGVSDQNVLVATLAGAGRAMTRLNAGGVAILDCEVLAPLRMASEIIDRQQLVATPAECLRATEAVLNRVLNQRKAA